jgi:hypothetical protein
MRRYADNGRPNETRYGGAAATQLLEQEHPAGRLGVRGGRLPDSAQKEGKWPRTLSNRAVLT